jgi:hypothetical protein
VKKFALRIGYPSITHAQKAVLQQAAFKIFLELTLHVPRRRASFSR